MVYYSPSGIIEESLEGVASSSTLRISFSTGNVFLPDQGLGERGQGGDLPGSSLAHPDPLVFFTTGEYTRASSPLPTTELAPTKA